MSDVKITVDNSIYSESEKKAQKFVSLIKEKGLTPGEAAKRVHTSLKKITSNPEMRSAVQQLVNQYQLPREARRMLAEAGLNKMFLESVESDDLEERKLALAIAKQIQVESGGKSADSTEINLTFDAIGGIIEDIEVPFQQQPEGTVIEIEKEIIDEKESGD